jgi:hypothetical protein
MNSEKMIKIYHNIIRGDEIILDAKKFTEIELQKIAGFVGTNKGSVTLKNSNFISKHIITNISNMSKQKVAFDYSINK